MITRAAAAGSRAVDVRCFHTPHPPTSRNRISSIAQTRNSSAFVHTLLQNRCESRAKRETKVVSLMGTPAITASGKFSPCTGRLNLKVISGNQNYTERFKNAFITRINWCKYCRHQLMTVCRALIRKILLHL